MGLAGGTVFFADEATAVAARNRPCGICLPTKHRMEATADTPHCQAVMITFVGARHRSVSALSLAY
jgi:methylphosphotriester-DNA--protein-cysteine methyltransferase